MIDMLHHIQENNFEGLDRLRKASMLERIALCNAAFAERPHKFGDDPEMVRLAVYGALSLIATVGTAAVPTVVYEVLGEMVLQSYRSPQGPSVDAAEQ